MRRLRTITTLVAAGALLVVPAVGDAHHNAGHDGGKGKGKAQGKSKRCKKPTVNKGFVVAGTLTNYTAGGQESVAVTVTGANKHARVSGELADQNQTQGGTQVVGGSYTVDHVNPTDPFTVTLEGYEPGETPGAGDLVRIVGKVAVTKKKCAGAGDTVAERYGAVDVRRVTIVDAD